MKIFLQVLREASRPLRREEKVRFWVVVLFSSLALLVAAISMLEIAVLIYLKMQ